MACEHEEAFALQVNLHAAGAGGWRREHQLCVHCGGPIWGGGAEAGAALHPHSPRLAPHTGAHAFRDRISFPVAVQHLAL